MSKPNEFELAAIRLILQREAQEFPALMEQVENLSVTKREFSGVGFFTHFEVPRRDSGNAKMPRLVLGNSVIAKIPGLKNDCGFALFIEEEGIEMLEGFTYGEPWPSSVDTFELV